MMVQLLSARATMDMHHQWVILETEVGHCQNESDTFEAIREIKAQYTATIGDAEAAYIILQDCNKEGRGHLFSFH